MSRSFFKCYCIESVVSRYNAFDGKLQLIVLVVEEFVFSLSFSGYVLEYGALTMGN